MYDIVEFKFDYRLLSKHSRTMLEKNNDDSSSSEDEISTNAIKEATDHQLLKEHYFSNEKFKNADVSKKPNECKYYNLTFISSYLNHILNF